MRGSDCTEDSSNTQFMCVKGQKPPWGFSVFCRVLRGEYRHINVCSPSSSGTWYFSIISCIISLAMKWVKFTQIIHFTFHFRIIASWNDRGPNLFLCDFILYTHLSTQSIIELKLGGMSPLPKESRQGCVCRHIHSAPLSSARWPKEEWEGDNCNTVFSVFQQTSAFITLFGITRVLRTKACCSDSALEY